MFCSQMHSSDGNVVQLSCDSNSGDVTVPSSLEADDGTSDVVVSTSDSLGGVHASVGGRNDGGQETGNGQLTPSASHGNNLLLGAGSAASASNGLLDSGSILVHHHTQPNLATHHRDTTQVVVDGGLNLNVDDGGNMVSVGAGGGSITLTNTGERQLSSIFVSAFVSILITWLSTNC